MRTPPVQAHPVTLSRLLLRGTLLGRVSPVHTSSSTGVLLGFPFSSPRAQTRIPTRKIRKPEPNSCHSLSRPTLVVVQSYNLQPTDPQPPIPLPPPKPLAPVPHSDLLSCPLFSSLARSPTITLLVISPFLVSSSRTIPSSTASLPALASPPFPR